MEDCRQVPEESISSLLLPHTSNYDFMIGLAVRSIMGFKASFLGKKELFRWPFDGCSVNLAAIRSM